MTKPERDRDAAIDRLLAAMRSTQREGACVDADELAAWADDALNRRQRSAVATHAATCERCQAILAAMARTAPHAELERQRARRRWLQWLVPLTAVGAAAAIAWTIQPWRSGPLLPRREDQVVTLNAPAPSPAQPTVEGVAPAPERQPSAPATPQAAPSVAQTPSQSVTPSVQTPPQAAPSTAQTPLRPTQPIPQAPSADASTLATSGQAGAAAAPPRAGLPIAPGPPGRAEAPATASAATAASRQGAAKAAAANQPAGAAGGIAGSLVPPAARTLAFAAAPTVILSPNPATRWRIVADGEVERSVDGGATWQSQPIGVNERMTAGSSTDGSVCWLVGPSGVVLLSTDGQSWKRLPFPEPVPLTAVRATDEQSATVTAADGRAFSTKDAGATWTAIPR